MQQRIIVTGTNSGFGKLSVMSLLEKGHQVVATMRDINGRNKEAKEGLEAAGAKVVEMDVTSCDSVNAAIEKSIELLGGVDVVVNNAGTGVAGMQEHFTTDDLKKLFDINVFGVQRVCRAVLPHMRKQGSGCLMYVSSLLGRMALPFYGPYNASKWALEALAENYRAELSGFGVDSCLVEPGGFPTEFMGNLMTPSDQSRNESYGEFMNAPAQMGQAFGEALAANPQQQPQLVADAIVNLIETKAGERPMRTVVDELGMGAAIRPYNDALEQVTEGIYSAFGMSDMLNLKRAHSK